MLSNPPYPVSGATETNMCTLLYRVGWVINTGDEMTVDPRMTGVVYALMGGGAYPEDSSITVNGDVPGDCALSRALRGVARDSSVRDCGQRLRPQANRGWALIGR